MLGILATAGGFGGTYGAGAPSAVVAPDALPKLFAAALLIVVLAGWVWLRLRTPEPLACPPPYPGAEDDAVERASRDRALR